MNKNLLRKYFFYLIRWQLSTPILAVCISLFTHFGNLTSTIIANLIGGLIFFWIDKLIFKEKMRRGILKPKSSFGKFAKTEEHARWAIRKRKKLQLIAFLKARGEKDENKKS